MTCAEPHLIQVENELNVGSLQYDRWMKMHKTSLKHVSENVDILGRPTGSGCVQMNPMYRSTMH